jgi:hypothetical protein
MTKVSLVAIAALATVLATPALAQQRAYRAAGWYGPYWGAYAQDYRAYGPYGAYARDYYGAYGAYASTWSGCGRPYSSNPGWDVCSQGAAVTKGDAYAGSDPDARIRQQLQFDTSGAR